MALTNCYLTIAQLRDVLRDQLTAFDEEYERAITAASRQIDDYCGRHFWRESAPVARLFRSPRELDLLFTSDIATSSGLIVETDDVGDGVTWTTWAAGDYQLEPGERMNSRPYERIAAIGSRDFPVDVSTTYGAAAGRRNRRYRIRVTAAWGWPSVPGEVVQACSILAVDHFKAKDLTHIAQTYGAGVRFTRDTTQSNFGRKIQMRQSRAPDMNPEAANILSPLRVIVVA